nr:cadherin-like beta sandwich domain-containing protein [uncultured Catonella sp.]
MRKNILWILVFIFVFFSVREDVFASSASVELKSDGVAVVGDKFDITMEIDSEESLSGIETYISYDKDIAEFLSADDGIAGGKGVLRVNIRDFEDLEGKLKYKMKFLARKVGNFTMSFSDEVHLYAADTDDEISVAAGDLEMRIKSKRDASSDSSLANIKIAGGKLVPSFSKSILDYTVNVGSDVENITIGIETSDGNSSYSYRSSDGDKLHEGENKRSIIVTAEDGSTTTYTITIIKAAMSEVENNEVTGASVKEGGEVSSKIASESAISETPEYVPDPPEEAVKPETNIKDSKQTVIYVIIGAVIVLGIMLVLGAVLYIKNKDNDITEE